MPDDTSGTQLNPQPLGLKTLTDWAKEILLGHNLLRLSLYMINHIYR